MLQAELQTTIHAQVDYLLRPLDVPSLSDPAYVASIESTRSAITNTLNNPWFKTDASVFINQRLREEVTLSIGDDTTEPQVRLDAWERVNTAIADPVLGSFAARALLFGYWSHLKDARQQNPQAEVRSDIIDLLAGLARRDELADDPLVSKVAIGIMELHDGTADPMLIPEAERVEDDGETFIDSIPAASEQLEISQAEMATYIDFTAEKLIRKRDLNLDRTAETQPTYYFPGMPTLADFIRFSAKDPDRLQALINGGTFTSSAARLAATMQVEISLLSLHRGSLNELMEDREKGRIKSVDGLNAHGAAIDRELLDLYVGDPAGLHTAIEAKFFTTEAGLRAAQTQHDYDMLADAASEIWLLRDRVKNRESLFYVESMADAAAAHHDTLLLQIHREHPGMLQRDIANESFFTEAGNAAALEELKSSVEPQA